MGRVRPPVPRSGIVVLSWPGRQCRVDRADRLAFGPQLWDVIGDSGSVSALRLRQMLARGGALRSRQPSLAWGRGPAQHRAPPHAWAAPSLWILV